MDRPADIPPFEIYGGPHIAAIVATFGVAAILIFVGRKFPESRLLRMVELGLAGLLLAAFPLHVLAHKAAGSLDLHTGLPLHLCNVSAVVGAWALWSKHRASAYLLYFWGILGAIQGLLTPALLAGFPSPIFLVFFALHGGLIIAALHLAYGRAIWPTLNSLRHALGWILVYLAIVLPINCGLMTNYGFVRHKPPTGSLLDALGPWPYYIIGIFVCSAIGFAILAIPFPILRALSKRRDKAKLSD